MNDLLDELDLETTTDEGIEKKERVLKPDIIIQLTETIRIVLMSDRRNLKLQTKSNEVEKTSNEELENEEDAGWKLRGYYGTRDWKGVLEKAYALAKEEKLSKETKHELENLREMITYTTNQIKTWAKQITDTLIINKINL